VCVLISLAGNYNSEFCPCHLSLEEFVNYIYLVTDTRKMFFEGLAFYGALYLLVNKSTYSVSHKAVMQTAMQRMQTFFFSTNHGLF